MKLDEDERNTELTHPSSLSRVPGSCAQLGEAHHAGLREAEPNSPRARASPVFLLCFFFYCCCFFFFFFFFFFVFVFIFVRTGG